MDYCIKIGLELHSVSREVYNVYDCQKSYIDQYQLQVEKLEKQNKALRELVIELIPCSPRHSDQASAIISKLEEIGGE